LPNDGLDLLTRAERLELKIGFRASEDESLGAPTEMAVDKLGWRLHQLFNDQSETPDMGGHFGAVDHPVPE